MVREFHPAPLFILKEDKDSGRLQRNADVCHAKHDSHLSAKTQVVKVSVYSCSPISISSAFTSSYIFCHAGSGVIVSIS